MRVNFMNNDELEIGESIRLNIGDISLLVFSGEIHDICLASIRLFMCSEELRDKLNCLIESPDANIFRPFSIDDEAIKNFNDIILQFDGIWLQEPLNKLKQELKIRSLGENIVQLCTDNQAILDLYKETIQFNKMTPSEILTAQLENHVKDLSKIADEFLFILSKARNMILAIWGLEKWSDEINGINVRERVANILSIPFLEICDNPDSLLSLSVQSFHIMHESVQIRLKFMIEKEEEEGYKFHYVYECGTFLDLLYLDIAKMLELGIMPKECCSCGRIFIPKNRKDEKYCDRIDNETGKTCKEVGALKIYKSKVFEKVYLKEKARVYSSIYAATVRKHRNNTIARARATDILKKWSYEANNKVSEIEEADEVNKQKLIDAFMDWLNKSAAEIKERR